MYIKESRRRVLNPNCDYPKKNVHNVAEKWSVVGLLMIFICWQISLTIYQWSPAEGSLSEQVRESLRVLNERLRNKEINTTLDFLKEEISRIEKNAHKEQRITAETAIVSGSYHRQHSTRVYHNIEAVSVKIDGESRNSFLVVFGSEQILYDSTLKSGHEAANLCAALEILRSLTQSEKKPKNSLIFLFGGLQEFLSEEKTHLWKKDIRGAVFIPHLGADGRHTVQFTEQDSHYLVNSYAKGTPGASTQAALEDFAHLTGLARDYGLRFSSEKLKVPAMSFIPQEEFFHSTKFDSVNSVSSSGLQRLARSVLALLRDLSMLPRVEFQSPGIYFDFLGVTVMHISRPLAAFFVLLIAILAVAVPFASLAHSTRDFHARFIWIEALSTFISATMAVFVTATVIYAIAVNLDASGKPMSWYGSHWLSLGLYSVPTLALLCFIHIRKANPEAPISLGLRVQSALLGINIAWIVVTAGLLISGYRLFYLPTILLALSLIPTIAIWLFNLQNTVNLWLYVHLAGQMIIMTWTSFVYHTTIHMLIPRTATLGATLNPDLAIGAVCATFTFFTTSYMVPLTLLLPQRKHLVYGLMGTFLVFRLILANSGLEFPYRDVSHSPPKPQRLILMHTLRTFYDTGGRIRYTDSGFWMQELDRNSRKTLESLSAPGMPIPQNDADLCAIDVACGLPFHHEDQLKTGGFWLPASGPLIRDHTHLKLESRKVVTPVVHQLDLSLIPKREMALMIRPRANVSLIQWTFSREIPPMRDFISDKSHFVTVESSFPGNTLNFTLTLKIAEGSAPEVLLDILLVAIFRNLSAEFTPTFTNMLVKIPPWASASAALATVKSYTF
ncbi:endoplasmic reticulum metallopeptidase 1-like [Phlebotomus argentipes]|uniref:endoplasmic reticulum metallopeptidase 1-like n=1 Tax=Phlebotomus argentipes TaxID=94469 RepID=UPI00289359C1|nr:endoplasmic reticulum metallopeptidase 1-like [Phlebotomus argentipes]